MAIKVTVSSEYDLDATKKSAPGALNPSATLAVTTVVLRSANELATLRGQFGLEACLCGSAGDIALFFFGSVNLLNDKSTY